MKMDASTTQKPKTMAELLPCLSGILSKEAIQTLTSKKQRRPTIAEQSRTAEKVIKPLTIAEMRADIRALKVQSPKTCAQAMPSGRKKHWNSSVKVDKKISHTSNGQMKNNSVRKVLNFQPKKALPISRMTINTQPAETPKFPKPESRLKKSLHLQARNIVRISGVCNIPETPVVVNKPIRSRLTLANKENITNQPVLNNKTFASPKPSNHKILHHRLVPETPLSNESWKSSCDASFLQKEKEIHDSEEKARFVSEEQTLEKIADISPPVSTPFKEYRNVKEYFNNSSELETSALYNDNTIMCFDKPSLNKENNREESVIVSLCDLLNKTKVSNYDNTSTELQDLLEVERQTEHNIKMIISGIQILNNIKESQLKSLQYVKKLIAEKNNGKQPPNLTKTASEDCDRTLVQETKVTPKARKLEYPVVKTDTNLVGKTCSVIKSPIKSPSYVIPKKNLCLRKKVIHKSMPNVSNTTTTSPKEFNNRALDMYMKMKEQMNFLNTPVVKHTKRFPDTPSVTSYNLQRQLDKLYGGS